MTTWWELAIPAASAIGGSAVTAVIQGIIARSQRKNEKRLRFIEDRRDAYLKFLVTFDVIIETIKEPVLSIEYLRKNESRMIANATRFEALLEEIASEPESDVRTAKMQEATDLFMSVAKGYYDAQKLIKDSRSILTKLDGISSDTKELNYMLSLLAPGRLEKAMKRLARIPCPELINNEALVKRRRKVVMKLAKADLN